MDYRKSFWLYYICVGAAILLLLLAYFSSQYWLGILGIALFAAGALQSLIFYRCPQCGALLTFHRLRPDYCSKCGTELEW